MERVKQLTGPLTTSEFEAFTADGVFPPVDCVSEGVVPFDDEASLSEQGGLLLEGFEDPFIGEAPIIAVES